MVIGRSIGYTRWYDQTPEMSQAVRLMERISTTKQQWIAHTIVSLMPLYQVTRRTDGLKKLGTEKVIGLLKSKVKRRWYDHDPLVHQAFNHLYLMDEDARHEMAVKVLITIKALESLNIADHSLNSGLKLVKSIFDKPLSYLKQKTHFVIQAESKHTGRGGFALEVNRKVQPSVASTAYQKPEHSKPTEDPAKATRPGSNGVEGSQDSGMKIVRLKRVSNA